MKDRPALVRAANSKRWKARNIETLWSPDPIIDRSPEQKQMRVDKLRAELLDLGYAVVTAEWLASVMKERAA